MTLWFVYDRTTGDPTQGPPGFRGESGLWVAAHDSDGARLIGWRALSRHDLPRTIGQRRALRASQPIRVDGPPRVLTRDEALAVGVSVERVLL